MSNLNQEKQQYDTLPVIYCKSCLSLRIENYLSDVNKYPEEEGIINEYDYCNNCGATDLGTCSITEYQELYKQRYGHYPLETF